MIREIVDRIEGPLAPPRAIGDQSEPKTDVLPRLPR